MTTTETLPGGPPACPRVPFRGTAAQAVRSAGIWVLVLAAALATGACSRSGRSTIADAESLLSQGRYDEAKKAAFDASGPEKYDLINKIDARKKEAESELADIKYSVEHALKEEQAKVTARIAQISKATKDQRVRAEAEKALAALPDIYKNAPKPAPIPDNVKRPEVIESEPERKIRVLDTKPPEGSLKKKTSMAPTPRVKEVLEAASDDVNRMHYQRALELLAMAGSEMTPEENEYLKSAAQEIRKLSDQALATLVSDANSDFGNRLAAAERLYSRLGDFPPGETVDALRAALDPVMRGEAEAGIISIEGTGAMAGAGRSNAGDSGTGGTVKKGGPGGRAGFSWSEFLAARKLEGEGGVNELFRQGETAMSGFDFASARNYYERAAAGARLDVFKNEALERASDASRLVVTIDALAQMITTSAATLREFDPGTGRRGQVTGATAAGLVLESQGLKETIGWKALSGTAWKSLFAKLNMNGGAGVLTPENRLGAGMLLSLANLEKESDQLLKGALDANPNLQKEIEAVLARRRGIEPPAYGFVWFNDRFITFKERENYKLAERIRGLLAKLDVAPTERERDAISTEISTLGAEASEALVIALKDRRGEIIKKLHQSGLSKKVKPLLDERVALDAARKHALDLIFDEAKYFYPYRPPECPPEKAKLYPEVQQEVARRVAAVKELWDSKTVVPLASSLGLLKSLQDVNSRLHAMRVFDTPDDPADAVYLAVDPKADALTIQNICLTPDELVKSLEANRRVRMFNSTVISSMSKEEVANAEITNQYREMFGRRILAYNNKIAAAAHKHSKWMADTGNFSHFSTLPGLRTPFERMRAEKYDRGISENIAMAAGAAGAFYGWQSSSGHHRNMLMEGHTEFGIGGVGNFWTQNFGVGTEYKENAAWRE